MSFDDDFNEIIQQKFQNRKFEFEEKKWDKVNELIEAGEREGKRRLWFRIAIPSLIIFTILSFTPNFSIPDLKTASSKLSPCLTEPAGKPQTFGKSSSSAGLCTTKNFDLSSL